MDESSLNPDRVLVEDLQEKLTKSAEVGKHLLEECEMLREQMEVERNEYTAKMEVLLAKHVRVRAILHYVGNIATKLQPQAQIRHAV